MISVGYHELRPPGVMTDALHKLELWNTWVRAYSIRNARIGSTRVARLAGRNAARTATPMTNTESAANVRGSKGSTSKSIPCSRRVRATDPISPIPAPARASVSPRRRTIPKMSRVGRPAPGGSRTVPANKEGV